MGIIRKVFLKFLKTTAFNTSIKHHHTNFKFYLNTYNHKGYWFYGKEREKETVAVFKKWIQKNDYVLEIGGHIGYFSTLYSQLVGPDGKVDVFEPSETNLVYLKKNIGFLQQKLNKNVTLVAKGAGDTNEILNFYIDPISGQNNSFIQNFDGFLSSREASGEHLAEIVVSKVEVITLDSYFENSTRFPDFVKIDVEGFEWNVLQGFEKTITHYHPKIMVEIHSEANKIISFFKSKNYKVFNDELEQIQDYNDYLIKRTPNIFFSQQ